VSYNNGLEYHCRSGYSVSGSPSGSTKITARVTSTGTFSPALPRACKKIKYVVGGVVRDARNGDPLPGVKIFIRGTRHRTTTSSGYFAFPNVRGGRTKLVYAMRGYIRTSKLLTISENIGSGGVADISMSPRMGRGQWRATLKWGEQPADLDAYVKWGSNKVGSTNREQGSTHVSAQLEHDVTDGFGPETIHMAGVGRCRGGAYYCDIRYYVNDATASGKMPDKMADVTLFTGNRVAGQWHIKDCPRAVTQDGNSWHVFTLDGRTNRLKWNCRNGAPPAQLRLDIHARQPHLQNGTQMMTMPVARKQNLRHS